MPKYRINEAELHEQLQQQITFLENSAKSFDQGIESEAKRIATAIRILVHDTQKSKSILSQLGQKTTLLFWAIGNVYKPALLSPFHGLVNILLPSLKYTPKLDPMPRTEVPFDTWWNEPVLKEDEAAVLFSRKDLILALANRDGGAHVDPELDEAYAKLSRNNAIGYSVAVGGNEIDWKENPVLPTVRAIGHEILGTLKKKAE